LNGDDLSRSHLSRPKARGNPFRDAIKGDAVSVIAEVKRRSPSKGTINASIDSGDQARRYTEGGASAISVLTEPLAFGGSDDDLALVRASTDLPMLKKDFHVTETQIIQASALGASAALVIVRAIEPERVRDLANVARDCDLELVFEIRDETELDVALSAGASIIGVNNRNLETLEIDASTVDRLIPLIPPHIAAIAESGYSSRDQVERAARAGADAVLVGSAISGADDPTSAVRALTGVKTAARPG
jgi:indole-3-glycerol phosphate synthase